MVEQSGMPAGSPVLLCGVVPPLAEAYYQRAETSPDLAGSVHPGQVVVLVHGEVTYSAPAAQGGTGKTQLAVEFARMLQDSGAVEVLAWVTAASRESIVAGFAEAAVMVGASPPGEDAEMAAGRFVAWLSRTRRRWALVLDDLAEVGDLDGLWPAGAAGRVVITTRLPAAAFDGRQVRVVPVAGLNRGEALSYLASRLTGPAGQRIEALDLAEDLDGVPLGLAQAAAVMTARQLGCREYRVLLAERIGAMPVVDGVSAPVLATWSIAAECARERPPAGLTWPALVLAAVLDPHGVPGAVLTSPAACGYITGRPDATSGADQEAVRAAFGALVAAGLVTVDPASPARTVQMHASVRAAVRAALPADGLDQAVLAAADALAQAWPDGGSGRDHAGQALMEQALRDCTGALRECSSEARAADGGVLWKPEAHRLLFRAGRSLEDGRLSGAAITYWRSLLATSTRLLGRGHANAVAARDRLAAAYEAAGRPDDAVAVFAAALADRERNLGPGHAETIAARGRLAHACQAAGQPDKAAAGYEHAAADAGRLLGPAHPVTLDARAGLAAAYQAAGNPRQAISAFKQLADDAGRLLGQAHPATLAARTRLAAAYSADGQAKHAIGQYEQALAGYEQARGQHDPDTITARANLAAAYRAAGRHKDAIAACERVLADRDRTEGGDHPDTIAARASLASTYRAAGRLRDAIPVYERTLADRIRVQGLEHPDTLTARSSLAACYHQARRWADAIPAWERVLADSEQMLEPGDLQTLTTRCNLAAAYLTVGRLTDAVAVLQRALTDCEQYLGPEHHITQTVRGNLEAATQS